MKVLLVLAAFLAFAASQAYIRQDLILGFPAVLKFGEANTKYCVLRNNFKDVVFENFGPCSYRIKNVRPEHEGVWSVTVFDVDHLAANATSVEIVTVKRPEVQARFSVDYDHHVTLICSVNTTLPIKIAKFRSPQDNIILVGDGGEDTYYEDESEHYNDPDKFSDENNKTYFALKINKPQNEVAGLWRCGLQLDGQDEVDNLFGFINIPKINDESSTPKYTTPSVRTRQSSIRVSSGSSFTLMCDIDASIDFCHFRSLHTEKIYAVAPGVSTNEFEYTGAGFDAGECGITIFNAQYKDMGQWTCTVDARDDLGISSRPGHFDVIVEGIGVDFLFQPDGRLQITANSNFDLTKTIDHCRFVRSNGDIFIANEMSMPGFNVILSDNWCSLEINQATPSDRNNWLVGVTFKGESREFTTVVTPAVKETLPPPQQPRPPTNGGSTFFWVWRTFFGFLILGFMLVLFSLMITDYRRKWASRKSIAVRQNLNNNLSHINTNNNAPNQATVEPRLVEEKHAMA